MDIPIEPGCPENDERVAWDLAPEDAFSKEHEAARRRRNRIVAVAAAWILVVLIGILNTTFGRDGYPQIDTPGFLRERSALATMAGALTENDNCATALADIQRQVDDGALDSYTATGKLQNLGSDLAASGRNLESVSVPAVLRPIYQLVDTANHDLLSCVLEYQAYLMNGSARNGGRAQQLWSQYTHDQSLAVNDVRQAADDSDIQVDLPGNNRIGT